MCAVLTQPMSIYSPEMTLLVSFFFVCFVFSISVCPVCFDTKVCVLEGSSASCQCPSGYVDDGSGGCSLVPGMFPLL